MKDYYHILGVGPSAPLAEIKKAYRALAVQHHPDKTNGDRAGEERFKEISVAYGILSDENTRSEYDYIKGYKTTYRSLRVVPGETSAVGYLIQFNRVKTTVLNAGGRVNTDALFTVLADLLSDKNIAFLIAERDRLVISRVIGEVLTCCAFLQGEHKTKLLERLTLLANGNAFFLDKIARHKGATKTMPLPRLPENENSDVLPRTTILIFALFLVLFILLFLLR